MSEEKTLRILAMQWRLYAARTDDAAIRKVAEEASIAIWRRANGLGDSPVFERA
ncbi:MAG: hypothetical protein JOY99_14680 [Sphingomonadaceae bacterium]|nr:hypothetical protein [Sphingomonadaceae bacterium]